MSSKASGSVYRELGVKPIINATGWHLTRLGGSILSPGVNQAMTEANRYYVHMRDLLAKSGQVIADLLGAEAAYVTSGCCAAMALGSAACMAGTDQAKMEQLPDVRGLKHEILIQKGLRTKYDRCVTVPGARLVEVGDASGTTPRQLEAAIGPNTLAIHYLAPSRGDGLLSLEEVIRIAHAHGLAVIVDAAGQVYPIERMKSYMAMGCDLVCYGAKYFGAPNSTGILCGRKDLIDAAGEHSFVGFETTPVRAFGRPMKLDRQEVVAVVAALREWLSMDHEARFAGYAQQVQALQRALSGMANAQLAHDGSPITGLRVTLDEQALGKTASQVAEALLAGDPSVMLRSEGQSLVINVTTIVEGDQDVIVDALKRALAS